MKKFSIYSIFLYLFGLGFFSNLNGQASNLPYLQSFDTSNDFTFVNGTQTNKWVYGTATGNTGSSIYISNDDGVTNAYTINTTSTTQAYKDFTIPAGSTIAKLSFDWKAEGQTTLDYMRVWLVPVTYTPTAGTQVSAGSGRIQVNGNFNQENTWQTYSTPNLNVSSFAGNTMRLVFEWRNNASTGTQTPAAIDNFELSIPTCLVPSNLTSANVATTTSTLNWNAPNPAPASGYEYYYSTTNTVPTATTAGTQVTTATANVTGLTPSTLYYWWIRSVCSATDKSDWLPGTPFLTKQVPATLPYTQDFATANDFYLENGAEVNKWSYGTAAGNTANSIYVSSDNGLSNFYNVTEESVVHAYRDFAIAAGSTIASFSFDWKAQGQTTLDYMRVWLVPSTFVPTAGTQITAGNGRIQVNGNFNQENTWQTYSVPDLNVSSFAGATMRIVYEWRNNTTTGTQTPAAIDNINLSIPTCLVPSAPVNTIIGATTATLNWTAPAPIPASGYEYYITTTNTPPTAATPGIAVTGTTANVTGLNPLTTYYWWVRSVCTTTDKSDWIAGDEFITTQIPATLPYNQNFSMGNDFVFENGTLTNKWSYGSAAGNTANSIYISNDNGVTNAYTINSTTTVQAYRDIAIPAGSTTADFTFDWKAEGQTTLDYFRVWLVPTTYSPTAGSQITTGSGRMQVGGNFNQENTWQTYNTPSLNISSFAGRTMRLVFEWRNNVSLGTQTPVAIDNIILMIPSCLVPTTTVVSNIGGNSATLGWAAPNPAPASGYEYFISTTNTPPTAATTGTLVTPTTANATGLAPSTTYFWWVRSVCGTNNVSDWIPGPSFKTTQTPATLPYSQNFESNNDLELVNDNQTNKWFHGGATGNTGNSLYISDDNGVTNNYTITSLSSSHAYRDIVIPAGSTISTLSFDWKAEGQTTLDYMRVWLVPATYNPTPGSTITAGSGRIQVNGNFNQKDAWTQYLNTTLNISSFAGTTMRLVFEWRNNTSVGTQTPAAVDNINLFIPSCFAPTAPAVNTITTNTATLTWTVPNPAPANGYEYFVSTTNTQPTATTVGTIVTTNTANLTGLLPNTVYYWWVRSVCSTTDKSLWITGPDFNTEQIPTTIPYVQDFTTGNDLTLANGTQENRWVYGNATGNTANSIYISDDNGVTNNYNIAASSIVHAYRDIIVPAGATVGTISFDWKADGQTTLDYMRVWLVPVSYKPNPGTGITAVSGRIQIGGYFNQVGLWQSYNNTNVNISSFAGNTMRLVFEWRSNTTTGNQNPAAVDNIKVLICNNATPTVTVTGTNHNSTVLTWNQDIGGASYTIRYRPVNTTNWDVITVAAAPYPATTNTQTLTNLLPATLYEVEIAAICNNNIGTYSHSEFTTKCDPTPPNISFSNITTTSALITWNPLAANSTYILRWREVGTTTWNNVTNLVPPTNTYQLNNLSSYKTYEVQVANICNGETNPNNWSNPNIFTTERECQIAPPGLTITQLTPTSAEVVWQDFPGATYVLQYRKVGLPGWNSVTVNTNTYTITGLLELTKYEMKVANICNGMPGNFTELYYFTTPTVVYCQMSSADGSSEYISKVTATPTGKPQMINETLGSTYSDFTTDPTKTIELIQGSSNNQLTIDKNLTAGTKAGVAVWIDFDRNGYFDVYERIVAEGPNTNAKTTATFSVPTDANISIADYKFVVMRIAMQKDGIPVNCENFATGEVEDYIVRITKQGVPNALNQNEIIIYPNPVKDILFVKNIDKKTNYKIYSAAGRLVSTGVILNNQIKVSNLINGVYVIDIEASTGSVQKKFIKE